MNLHIIGIIISREYQNRVRKKSFLITTFLVPVLMAALCIVPMVLMLTSKDKVKTVAVVDKSGIVAPCLENSETIIFEDLSMFSADSVKSAMNLFNVDAVLSVSELDEANRTVCAEITSMKPLGIEMSENISHKINSAVEAYRVESYNIPGLEQIMKDVKADIKLKQYTMDEEGKESVSEAGVYAVISMILGLVIFLFITLFGGMVMSAVIEEKSSRVVEVLVSSVKATELMFGKIIGIAAVALTQFLLWILLTFALVGGATAVMGQDVFSKLGDDPVEMASAMGVDASQAEAAIAQVGEGDDASVILGTLSNLPIGKILVYFFLFFIFGYLMYATLYAAIGSAVENEGDTQQLQLPVTIPLMIAYFIAIYTFKSPESSVAFWGSIIPFTSPIVMLARLPFGVADWELALSLALLVVTTVACAWISAKIYKVGILMFGKKSTWKDLWKWLKQK
ncbi:MAG: ABC transporter permease [Bacteroidales bacterium]|nr:ABC transporter permease [Bacteroidales bacterium]